MTRNTGGILETWLGERVAAWLDLPAATASVFHDYVRPCHYAAGETLFDVGVPVDDAVVFETGVVRAFHLLNDREVNLRLLGGPAVALPYLSFLDNVPADEALQALTPIRGVRLRLRAFCQDHSGVLVERLRSRLAEAHVRALQRRVRMLQGRRAAQRYAFFRASMDACVVAHTPGYHVASYLGMTSESLSRLRRRDLDKSQ